jgi:hypothetical protein
MDLPLRGALADRREACQAVFWIAHISSKGEKRQGQAAPFLESSM